MLGMVVCWASGCVSLDEHRQLQMHNRNLTAEKAELEQELNDLRNTNESLTVRADSLADQLGSKEALVANLQAENDSLETGFRRAQEIAEQLANRPLDKPVLVGGALPAELDSALQGFARQYPGSVTYDPQRGVVRWTSSLLFPTGSDVVKAEAKTSLSKFSEIMRSAKARGFAILVAGHTDNVKIGKPKTRIKHPTNWHLSSHRAIAVKDELVGAGIDPSRIGTMGFGEYRPLASNDDPKGRAANRRVEVYIVPAGRFGTGKPQPVMTFTGEQPDDTVK